MDVALSIVTGLSLRALLVGVNDPSGNISAAMIGIFEGFMVHQLSTRSPSELDHYLAYGLRIAIDHFVSRNPRRTAMIVLWTALGALASESVNPRSFTQPSEKRGRRQRPVRSLPSHVRAYQHPITPEPTLPATASAQLPLLPPKNKSTTPRVPVHRPPSPPSFFLHDADDAEDPFTIPAQIHPLDLSPTRPPTGLASHLEKGDDTPSPKPAPLPTPPQSTPSEGIEFANVKVTPSPHRLSTIHEMSSGDETTPEAEGAKKEDFDDMQIYKKETEIEHGVDSGVRTPEANDQSRLGSPLPVPNLTMHGFSISNPFNGLDDDDDDDDDDMGVKHSTPYSRAISTAVPVPNPTTENWRSSIHSAMIQDLGSPLSDLDDNDADFDELRTPPIQGAVTDDDMDNDPLRTPITMRPQEMLSPLIFDEPLASGSTLPPPASASLITHIQPISVFQPLIIEANTDLGGPSTSIPGLLDVDPEAPPPPISTSLREPDPPSDPETLMTESDNASVLSTRSPTKLTRKAEQLRVEARDADNEWSQLKADYATAVTEKRVKDALLLKGKMFEAEERAKKLHKAAAKRYYASLNDYNPKKKTNTIDVHGLRPGEALERTERALRDAVMAGNSSVKVIVGKGLHSANGKPILKNVITTAMERQKITCRVDTRNAGLLVLTLPP